MCVYIYILYYIYVCIYIYIYVVQGGAPVRIAKLVEKTSKTMQNYRVADDALTMLNTFMKQQI